VSTLATVVASVLVAPILVACASAAARDVTVDPRVDANAARGRSRVLVELRIDGGVTPEGTLTPERAAAQRKAIADTQDAVLSRLRGTDATLVRRFETTPLLALEIGPSALAALKTMSDLVTRVVPDTVIPPAGSAPR
jgi:hypothetical protein